MEKWVHRISFLITACFIYIVALYGYLSMKGFQYHDGTFTLISEVNAKENDEVSVPEKLLDRNLALNFKKDVIAGSQEAPVTIYEFSSLGCTHCADFHLNGLPKLKKEFLDKDQVNIVFVHFPLDRRSMQVAMLSECVEPLRKASFISLVFSRQHEWVLSVDPTKYFLKYAAQNGLTESEAQKCLKNDDIAKELIANRQEAIDKLKIEGTPAFLISSEGRNEMIYGFSNIDEIQAALLKAGAKQE